MNDKLSKLEDSFLNPKKAKNLSYLATSLMGLRMALQMSGLACGRLLELKGAPLSGKLFFGLQAIKDAQNVGKMGWLIDCDNIADPQLLQEFGINMSDLLYSQPNDSEETFELLYKLLEYNVLDIIVVNSILALFSLTYNYQWFRTKLVKLQRLLKQSKTTIIVINPYNNSRYDILSDFASIIISLKRRYSIKIDGNFAGFMIDGSILKNNINLQCNTFKCKYLTNKGIEDI